MNQHTPHGGAASIPDVARLTAPLDVGQSHLVQVVFEACMQDGRWPLFPWVQAVMDHAGLDALEVLASFPAMKLHPHRSYTAAATDLLGRPPSDNSEVFVTLLGVWHLSATNPSLHDSVIIPMWKVLDCISATRRAFIPPRHEYVLPEISWSTIRQSLGIGDDVGIQLPERLLLSLLRAESLPGLLATDQPAEEWTARLDRQCQRLGGIGKIEDYLARRLIGRAVEVPAAVPQVPSPLGVVTAMDYLNVVWRLAYNEKTGPFRFHSAERVARLTHDVGTGEEFLAAMSAVGDTIANLDVRNESGSHPCDRLRARLTRTLMASSQVRALDAVEVLRAATRARHTGQHSTVSNDILLAWKELGVTYPPSDWTTSWNAVRGHLVDAINTVREELSLLYDVSGDEPVTLGS